MPMTVGRFARRSAVTVLIPTTGGIPAERLLGRLTSDKKTVQGKVHFVLPRKIGETVVVSGIEDQVVLSAIQAALE